MVKRKIVMHRVKLDALLAALGGFEEDQPQKRYWRYDRDRFAQLWMQGLPVKVIAARLGRTESSVLTMRCLYRLPKRKANHGGGRPFKNRQPAKEAA